MVKSKVRETDLYDPVKTYLAGQGYEVKAEIDGADVVATRGEDDPVVVELKTGFALALYHQAVDRQSLTDAVYIAVPHGSGRAFQDALWRNTRLCRRLGLGLLTVRVEDGAVIPQLDPAPYRPRKSKQRKERLLLEFSRRVGDPNTGGVTRQGIVTAYRQDVLRCVCVLSANGPMKAAHVAAEAGVENARRMMFDDYYGWFERVDTGIYQLSPMGHEAVEAYRSVIARLGD